MNEVTGISWDGLLDELGLDDPYLSAGYVETSANLELEGKPLFLHERGHAGDVIFPVVERPIPALDRSDLITPYGYGGPIGFGEQPPWEDFDVSYRELARERSFVTSFWRFHPVLHARQKALKGMVIERLADTVLWRLDRPEAFDDVHPDQRRVARRGLAKGAEVRIVEEPSDLHDFRSLYETTMRRVEADPFYFFVDSYWSSLKDRCGPRLVLSEALVEGTVIGGILSLRGGRYLYSLFWATSEQGRKFAANPLLLIETAQWALREGFVGFHLGGGVGGREDSLLEFKRRFDPGGRAQTNIGKAVHDPDAYREMGGEPEDLSGFFPAYRRPHPPRERRL